MLKHTVMSCRSAGVHFKKPVKVMQIAFFSAQLHVSQIVRAKDVCVGQIQPPNAGNLCN